MHFPLLFAVGLKSAAVVGRESLVYGAADVANGDQFCGAADADESPSSDVVDAESGNPFLDVVEEAGGSPTCGAVGVADESLFCGAVDEAPVCCGRCGTTPTAGGAAADGIGHWASPSEKQQLETGNAVPGLLAFSEDTEFQHDLVSFSGAPFGYEMLSGSERTHADYGRSVAEPESVV